MKNIFILFLFLLPGFFNIGGTVNNTLSYGVWHDTAHKKLLSNQVRITNRITWMNDYQRCELFERAGIAKFDDGIYDEYWGSNKVNPYNENEIPSTFDITLGEYAMPCKSAHVINSEYGFRKKFGRMHKGIDLKASMGDTVYAVFSGKVRLVKFDKDGYGNYVLLRHGNSTETIYAHLSKPLVTEGQYVNYGDPIALSGNTGRSTGPHLHFEIRYMGYAINPSAIFDFKNRCAISSTYKFDKQTYQKKRV